MKGVKSSLCVFLVNLLVPSEPEVLHDLAHIMPLLSCKLTCCLFYSQLPQLHLFIFIYLLLLKILFVKSLHA